MMEIHLFDPSYATTDHLKANQSHGSLKYILSFPLTIAKIKEHYIQEGFCLMEPDPANSCPYKTNFLIVDIFMTNDQLPLRSL